MSLSTAAPALIVTTGEPAGIGPALCARLGERDWPLPLVLIGDAELLARHGCVVRPGALEIRHVPLAAAVTPGRLDPANAPYVLRLLDEAIDATRRGEFAGMVTAPIHKGIIADFGVPRVESPGVESPGGENPRINGLFTGHTEYLAARCGVAEVVMMLIGGGMRVALMTTHLPLAEVPAAITGPALMRKLRIVHRDLVERFGIPAPRILVAGLNPHAGEGGHLGREEIEIIAPALAQLRDEGLDLEGPLPADTLFLPSRLAKADAVFAMYHDQGLPVLKHASFGGGVNLTLGLPILRTSVDHGTALDLAAAGIPADPGSLFAAVELAVELATRRASPGKQADPAGQADQENTAAPQPTGTLPQ